MSFSFTGLFANSYNNNMVMDDKWGTSQVKNDDDHVGLEVPNFKSVPNPSLPFFPSSILPSYSDFPPGFTPTELLNSSSFLSSPDNFNWRNSSSDEQERIKEDEKNYSDLSFQNQTNHESLFQSSSSVFQVDLQKKQDKMKFNESAKQTEFSSEKTAMKFDYPSTQSFSTEMATTKPETHSSSAPGFDCFNYANASQSIREQRRLEDGYNWRKYGEKQMKGSENPRSYYKCTHPNCSMKKKVERSLDGHITEIVYKGTHNHPKPESKRRKSSQSIHQPSSCTNSGISDQSVGEEEFEQTSRTSFSGKEEDDLGPEAKRWKGENENDGYAYSTSGSRTVKEPRVVVQTTSEIDILDDGYRWRKYGQKVVKGNPNPRNYYKCVTPGCSVRKHVERAAHDMKAVITTYEGKHNHDVPTGRGSASNSMNRTSLNSNISNVTAPIPIRPSAVTNYSNSTSFTNSLHDAELPTSESKEPFPLDMLLSPGTFGYSALGRSMGSYTNHEQYSDAACLASDMKKDDSFLQSFLPNSF